MFFFFFFFQAEDGIRDADVTGVQTCALPISTAIERLLTWRELTDLTERAQRLAGQLGTWGAGGTQAYFLTNEGGTHGPRSEERRVGKECRSRGWEDPRKKRGEGVSGGRLDGT